MNIIPSAFVAGATGYTGREVVHELRKLGVVTIAHVRHESPRLAEWRSRFKSLGAIVDTTPWTKIGMTATLKRLRPTVIFGLFCGFFLLSFGLFSLV